MPLTPFQARIAQVTNVNEAKELLMDGLVAERHIELVGGDYPFDVDLRGLLFHLQNRGIRPDEAEEATPSIDDLAPRFADAVWDLCIAGILRQGPRSPLDRTYDGSRGYSLTERGRSKIRELQEKAAGSIAPKEGA